MPTSTLPLLSNSVELRPPSCEMAECVLKAGERKQRDRRDHLRLRWSHAFTRLNDDLHDTIEKAELDR